MTLKEAEELGVNDGQRGYFVRFGVSKANYGAPFPERWLRRNEGGVLKPAVLERRRKTKEVLPFKKSEIVVEGADDNW